MRPKPLIATRMLLGLSVWEAFYLALTHASITIFCKGSNYFIFAELTLKIPFGKLIVMNDQIVTAVKTLHEGGVVAHPTETCYGLATDIFQRGAVQKLYALKKMPFTKPVSILVRDLDDAKRYGVFSPLAQKLATKYWPGPLTIIVPRTEALPKWVNFEMETVGFRVSSNKYARKLIEAFKSPLTTTSANLTTLPQAYSVQDFLDQGLKPDFVIDGGKIGEEPPSTIVEVIDDSVKIIRQGSIVL